MRQGLKLLILAGSAEARVMAARAQDAGAQVRALVSEPPRGPNPMPVPCDLHGFEDVESVMGEMRGVDVVLDASHGFDGRMSALGFAAATALGLPFLSFRRPGWDMTGNRQSAVDVAAAMSLILPTARVFSAAGWASLPECANFPGAILFLRQTSPHKRPVPFDFVTPVFGDPPFSVESEIALFEKLNIDTLLARNLGGRASRPKLDAAEALELKVILIEPPALPAGAQVVADMDEALAWVRQR